jgi:hypothetical protein
VAAEVVGAESAVTSIDGIIFFAVPPLLIVGALVVVYLLTRE